MSTSFPTSLDTLTNPAATDSTSTVDHAAQHANANDAIEALEAKVGVNSSAVTSSLDYKVTNTASVNPGHKHTTAGLSITGTPDGTKFLKDDGSWATPPTTTDATASVAGVVELATSAEIDAGTATGSDGPLVVTPDQLAASGYGSAAGFVPTMVGVIVAYGGATAPTGWLMCDGTAVSRTTYSGLFSIIGTAYGVGDGSTTFNTPDMRGNVGVGKDASTFSTLGASGGEETHTLTVDEMPAHTHAGGVNGAGTVVNGSAPQTLANGNTGSTGGGSAHNNLQPYLVVNYIIKT